MGWLKGELQRQLQLGSYEEIQKTGEEVVAKIVKEETKMKQNFTEREAELFSKYYRSSQAQGRRLGLIRIQVSDGNENC